VTNVNKAEAAPVTEPAVTEPAVSGRPVLEVDDVTAGYGDSIVLRGVSLVVPAGTIVALLGPNGAGKTTLLRAASGQIRPISGIVRLSGENVTGQKTHQMARKGLCIIPEGRGIFPSLSVRENLALFSAKGQEQDAMALAVSAFPELGKFMKRTAGSLSGGEQQMLAVVRSYLVNASVVLVDEASMGLAPVIVDRLLEFFATVAAQGTALLLVEQYVSQALALADYVYLLNQGKVVHAGSAAGLNSDEIFSRYLGVEDGTGISTGAGRPAAGPPGDGS
jgi:branched-chain amino acid transport system ATP-binding protein